MKKVLILFCLVISLFGFTQATNDSIILPSTDLLFTSAESTPTFSHCFGKIREKQKCFQKGIYMHIHRKFNMSVVVCIGKKKVFDVRLKKYVDECVAIESGKKRIIARFFIEKDGSLGRIEVKAPHPKLKEETFRVLKNFPKISPCKINGRTVAVRYVLPITLSFE